MKAYYLTPMIKPECDLGAHFTNVIHDSYNKVLEDCLLQLLQQYLGRPAKPEDGKRVTIGIFSNDPDRPMLVSLDGTQVGTIKVTFDGPKLTAIFNPNEI